MRHGSLFSGIGGFDLAAEWMGWKNVFHCERNEFGQKVLKYYWPNAKSYGDIKATDFTVHRGEIDILTGGFPCQPYSLAGKRKGKEDDRHLWPEMLRAIREIQASWIVGENVRGLTNWNGGLVFDEVQSDLEAEGYEIIPFLLPACAVDAPHRRDRIWFVANRHNNGQHNGNGKHEINTSKGWEYALNDTEPIFMHPNGNGFQRGMQKNESEKAERFFKTPIASMERNGFENFPTEPPLCRTNDGIPNRVDRIKALGNAIVPQVAYEIFKAIEKVNEDRS